MVDRGIIEALQANGRSRSARSPPSIGVAEATVRARYARLVEDDVLQVTGITNPLGLGFDALALLGINTAGASEPVADELSPWSETSYVVIAAGRFDVLVEVRLRRPAASARADEPDPRELPGVVTTETFPTSSSRSRSSAWGTHLETSRARA